MHVARRLGVGLPFRSVAMLRVGLTGGIACGKTEVARELARLGLAVVDADRLAREVVEPGRPAFDEVVARFGGAVVGSDGRLDRGALGRLVFSDPAARLELEAITHPRIAEAGARQLARLEAEGQEVAVYEAALLVESGLARAFDLLVVVAAGPETQRRRLAERDGLDAEAARGRLGAQLPLEDKLAVADLVVWNEGDLESLRERVGELARELRERARG